MVEAVDGAAVEVEAAHEPAEVGRALVERDADARECEPVRGRHAEDAAPDDADARALPVHTITSLRMRAVSRQ